MRVCPPPHPTPTQECALSPMSLRSPVCYPGRPILTPPRSVRPVRMATTSSCVLVPGLATCPGPDAASDHQPLHSTADHTDVISTQSSDSTSSSPGTGNKPACGIPGHSSSVARALLSPMTPCSGAFSGAHTLALLRLRPRDSYKQLASFSSAIGPKVTHRLRKALPSCLEVPWVTTCHLFLHQLLVLSAHTGASLTCDTWSHNLGPGQGPCRLWHPGQTRTATQPCSLAQHVP